MRNDLLEQIVIASGGTVTNKDDRSALLSDWLAAVSMPKAEIALLDGATKSWDFSSPIPLGMADNCKVSLKLILNRNTTQVIYGGGSSPERLYIGTENGNWLVGNGTDRVDTLVAVPIGTELTTELVLSGGVFKLLVNDSVVYEQPIKYSTSKSLTGISDLSGFRLFGYAYDFEVEVDSVIANSIPLTNKPQGATQLATVGNINATMINYTGDEWGQLP